MTKFVFPAPNVSHEPCTSGDDHVEFVDNARLLQAYGPLALRVACAQRANGRQPKASASSDTIGQRNAELNVHSGRSLWFLCPPLGITVRQRLAA
jgi:hypothetical protein